MRHLLPTALIFALLSTGASHAQVKKSGGFFGFKRDDEQLSSGLFPTEITTRPVSQTSSTPQTAASAPPSRSTASSEGIFRGGSPAPVAPVSYTIENGQKVEKSEGRKKPSLFGFGKKDKSEEAENPIVTPVPAAPSSPYVSPTAAPVVEAPAPAPAPAEPTPATEQPAAVPVVESQSSAADPIPDTPTFKTDDNSEKSGGFFSFFNRKKSEPVAMAPAQPVATPSNTESTETDAPAFAGQPVETSNTESGIFEVPSVPTSVVEPEKEKKGIASSILSPVKKMAPPKKEIDLTGAETIIANGEIVADDSHDLSDRIVTTQGDGKKDPPKIVNGVKTYSSWEDVEGTTQSAAEKIIRQIR